MGETEVAYLIQMEPYRFHLRPNQAEVFDWLRCRLEDACYYRYEEIFSGCVDLVLATASPRAAAAEPDITGHSAVFLTLGHEVETAIETCFRRGWYMQGSLMNTIADECLFQMDEQLTAVLQQALKQRGLCIAQREEPGVTLSSSVLSTIFRPLEPLFPDVTISQHGVLYPSKSMMYALTLSEGSDTISVLHDCSRCDQQDCPYRKQEQVGTVF